MRYDVHPPDLSEVGTVGEEELSFAAFSLAHTAFGDDVLEVRPGESALLERCMACDVMRIFGPRVVRSSMVLSADRSNRAQSGIGSTSHASAAT